MKNIKRYGLVVAVIEEIKALLSNDHEFILVEDTSFKVYKTIFNNKELFIIHSGCGQVLASIATQYLITKYQVQTIFNFGICGALRKNLSLKSVCLVNEIIDYQFDTDIIDHCGIGYHYEINESIFKPSEELIKKALKIVNLPLYRLASGHKFVGTDEEREALNQKFNADICEMEAAGIYLTCKINKIPVLFIKGISDSYKGNANQYEMMAFESAKIASEIIIKIITNIE